MICPSCGCQQRDADYCIQCQSPISLKGKEMNEWLETSSSYSSGRIFPEPTQDIPTRIQQGSESHMRAAPKNILIATTQRIEGKRIRRYFGLIYANIVIESSDRLSSPESARHRSHFKEGMAKVMKMLREEAAVLGANAVVATSLNFQRIDLHSLLISAIGTAVQLEDPR